MKIHKGMVTTLPAPTTPKAIFTIQAHDDTMFRVTADSYEEAARIAAVSINGRSDVLPKRTTGEHGKSGWFRGYYWDAKLQCLNSIGQRFHVFQGIR